MSDRLITRERDGYVGGPMIRSQHNLNWMTSQRIVRSAVVAICCSAALASAHAAAPQELAVGPERSAEIPDADLPDSKIWDFTGSKFKADNFLYHGDAKAAEKHIHPTPTGLQFLLPAGDVKPQVAGIHPKLRIGSDFVTTVEYAGLKCSPPKDTWGSGVNLTLLTDPSHQAGIYARRTTNSTATSAMWHLVSRRITRSHLRDSRK